MIQANLSRATLAGIASGITAFLETAVEDDFQVTWNGRSFTIDGQPIQ